MILGHSLRGEKGGSVSTNQSVDTRSFIPVGGGSVTSHLFSPALSIKDTSFFRLDLFPSYSNLQTNHYRPHRPLTYSLYRENLYRYHTIDIRQYVYKH